MKLQLAVESSCGVISSGEIGGHVFGLSTKISHDIGSSWRHWSLSPTNFELTLTAAKLLDVDLYQNKRKRKLKLNRKTTNHANMAAPVGSTLQPSLKGLSRSNYGKPNNEQHVPLQQLVKPHIESFNYMLREGLSRAVQNIPPVEFALSSGQRVSICMTDASVGLPVVAQGNTHANTLKVFPAECRERGSTYRSKVQGTVKCTVDGRSFTMERVLGEVPVMVKSNVCNLAKLKPAELIQHGEEAEEMGGYFVINGNERIIRMLIMPRRNFPTCTIRPSWRTRGKQYTEYGVMMRCVKGDQTATNMVLHYLNNGTANLSFSFKKEQFFIPVVMVLKALVDCTDQHVYRLLIRGKEDDSFYKGCVANMLRQAQDENLSHQVAVLKYIGQQFRIKLQLPDWYSDQQVATFLLEQCICIHLETNTDKFNLLVHMTQKLFALAKGECAAESADNPMNQELLLGGHLYLMVIKEKIEVWLTSLKYYMMKRSQIKGVDYQLDQSALSEACGKGPADITRPMEYLMATGNLVSKTGLGLMQASGLTVVADKLNFMRYLSHFRCVHRGAFFAEMRTTTVRRLLPEAWGFLCPVHTPDGAPCGLLNHLSALCEAVNYESPNTHLPRLLASLGMSPYTVPPPGPVRDCYVVLLDGCLLGYVCDSDARTFVDRLRTMKVRGLERVPPMMEIIFVPHTKYASQYAGIYLFTGLARMMRPVKNLRYNAIEMIGTFEQAYLDICITADEFHEGLTTHQELNEYAMLSAIASLTPYSDCNQSPRNMYQCQMGKQTMGTPLHAFQHRSDNKLYRIQTPQSPIVRPYMHDHYNMDNYPLGTNAVVAVISYTGYDMEDAMILNKGSYERGFAHGSVYKTEFIDLHNISRERSRIALMFGCKAGDKRCEGRLGPDGLPAVGTYLTQGDPYYSYINVQTGEAKVEKYKSQEPAYVDQIKACGNDLGTEELQRICIVLRIQRNPIIGDKFASRHGQKGICSQKWPLENMPFTETGMVPDIIFNPHGFPSRMTIGMMIESMAGKSGAMHGLCHDATPFTFSEDNPAIDYFGRCLTKAGYNYHGTERLYSGINGREFEADIFIGVVYYQRLRHMVSDKFQVRTTGPIDQVTHQPVKGRKRAGGIRFGEMERDGLLAHGTSFLLQDRLLNCTDKSLARVCTKCGSIISTRLEKPASKHAAATFEAGPKWMCSVCKTRNTVETIAVPYVFRYLVAELAAMNIKVTLEVK